MLAIEDEEEEEEKNDTVEDDETVEYIENDDAAKRKELAHFSYFAFDGATGDRRWQHVSGDFEAERFDHKSHQQEVSKITI